MSCLLQLRTTKCHCATLLSVEHQWMFHFEIPVPQGDCERTGILTHVVFVFVCVFVRGRVHVCSRAQARPAVSADPHVCP